MPTPKNGIAQTVTTEQGSSLVWRTNQAPIPNRTRIRPELHKQSGVINLITSHLWPKYPE